MNLKPTKIVLLALTATTLASCGLLDGDKIDESKETAIGNKVFTIVDDGIVGVSERENKLSSYLYKGSKEEAPDQNRCSLYFLNEGAVITVLNPKGATNTPADARKIKDMLDFEKIEFSQAIEFYNTKIGISTTAATEQGQPLLPTTHGDYNDTGRVDTANGPK
jgi:hypothetical protein